LIAEDITLIKNAVNNVLASPAPTALNAATPIASWADVVRSGTPSYPSTPNSRASTTASVKDRETVVKLDANSAAVLRKTAETAALNNFRKYITEKPDFLALLRADAIRTSP
jgi:hypothetical protein